MTHGTAITYSENVIVSINCSNVNLRDLLPIIYTSFNANGQNRGKICENQPQSPTMKRKQIPPTLHFINLNCESINDNYF